jgi:hypothetical protein
MRTHLASVHRLLEPFADATSPGRQPVAADA